MVTRNRARLLLLCVVAAVILGIRARGALAARTRTTTVDPTAALNAAVIAETEDLAAAGAKTRSESQAMSASRRLEWLRHCAHPPKCEPWLVDAIVDGAPPAEQPRALLVSFAAATDELARTATDDELAKSAASTIAATLARPGMGMALLAELPVTTLAAASKSPDRARGRTLKITGRIVELRVHDGIAEGILATEANASVRFFTAMGIRGLRVGASATYQGVFLRRDARGATLVVGAFGTPENR